MITYYRAIKTIANDPDPLILYWGTSEATAAKIADFAGAAVESQRDAISPWEPLS